MSVDQHMRRPITAGLFNVEVQPFRGFTAFTVYRGQFLVAHLQMSNAEAVELSCALMDAVNLRAANNCGDAS